jgi:Tol biopolymer transport system component
MRLARAAKAASCPPERRDIVQELVSKMGRRRTIIFLGLLGVAIAVLFLASGLLPTEPSPAQTTSPEGKIVYVKDSDIWVMDADGTNQTNLTNTPDINERDPAWSPDGTKIAFTGPGNFNADNSGGLEDIYVMDADPTTDDATSLTNTPNSLEYQPSWAPSGTQLAFVREVRKEELEGQIVSEQSDIFVMAANGQNATNLTHTEADEHAPDWSPDGTKIAFVGVRQATETATACPTATASATASATATACPEQPTAAWKILTMDPNGQNEAILTGDEFHAFDDAPEWSPDSTKIVFMKQCQGLCRDTWEIWGVNRDGSGDTNLTPNDLSEEDRHVAQHTGPSWSPDGFEITFTRTLPSLEGGQSDIYAMAAPTTLPPPSSETASAKTIRDSGGAMDFAAGDVLLGAASAQTTSQTALRRLTTDGLSTDPDWADTPADTTPPKVKSISPANTATLIAPGANVTATFSEAMDASPTATDGDPSTITGTTFKLTKAGTTTAIGAVRSYNATSKTATLNPNANLQLGTKYKAVVTTGTQDVAGNRLDQDQDPSNGLQQRSWTFTIRN